MGMQTEQELMKKMLTNSKTIAVIGLSDKAHRTSFQIAKAMQNAGYRIIPVNPHIESVLGEKAYDSILEVETEVDLINIFRRPIYLMDIAQDLIKTNIHYVWMQQGVIDQQAYELLREHGKEVVMDKCIKVAHSILMNR
ncbi:CoA-binding protein [Gracilibacillus sp. YIM 98692]|uniref:CoA-binding protein n=1 Tax=Gracilibacillus sp. YIM 98692 TaxID=2663532 RepID=UPI0013D5C51C|nr:CoA-binding protein [Gracilibacillus sp. YIM 98692]